MDHHFGIDCSTCASLMEYVVNLFSFSGTNLQSMYTYLTDPQQTESPLVFTNVLYQIEIGR